MDADNNLVMKQTIYNYNNYNKGENSNQYSNQYRNKDRDKASGKNKNRNYPPHKLKQKKELLTVIEQGPTIISREDWNEIKKYRDVDNNTINLPIGSIFFRGWAYKNIDFAGQREHKHHFYGDCNSAEKYAYPIKDREKKAPRGVIVTYKTIRPLRLYMLDELGVKNLIENYFLQDCYCCDSLNHNHDNDKMYNCKTCLKNDIDDCNSNFCRLLLALGYWIYDYNLIGKALIKITKVKNYYPDCDLALHFAKKTEKQEQEQYKHRKRESHGKRDRYLFSFLQNYMIEKGYDGLISWTLDSPDADSQFSHELILFEPISDKLMFNNGKTFYDCQENKSLYEFSNGMNQTNLIQCLKQFKKQKINIGDISGIICNR